MIGWILDLIVLIIAFAISPIVGFVWLIINIVYLVLRQQNAKTTTHYVERTALSVFELDRNDGDFRFSMQISFPDMLMLTYSACIDYPGWSKYRLFAVKRDAITGKWYIKHTPVSQQKELKDIRGRSTMFTYTEEEKQEDYTSAYNNEWVEITDIYPQMESNYQKWLRDGGRNELAPMMENLVGKPDT